MHRNDLSPTRRKTRNVIAAPIPRDIVKNAIDRVHHVPAWLTTFVYAIHLFAGAVLWATIVFKDIMNHQGIFLLVAVSGFLLATVASNSHFPVSMRRWFMAVSDLLLICLLRVPGDVVIVSDPNTTFVLLLGIVCLMFTIYLDPALSRFLAYTTAGLAQLLLLPYILPGIFEPLFNANLTHTWPLQSVMLLVALVMTSIAMVIIASTYRKVQLARATTFLERVQITLATRRRND